MASKYAIQQVIRDVFGTVPTMKGVRNPYKLLSKSLTGPYDVRHYPDPIETSARFAQKNVPWMPPYYSEQEKRRLDKLKQLRRRGKGPPKKGSGKRNKRGGR